MTNSDRYQKMAEWAENLDIDHTTFEELPHGDNSSFIEALRTSKDPEVQAAVNHPAPGRPSLDRSKRGSSPLWQVRAPAVLDARMREVAKAEGLTFSEVLRQAASEYADRHTEDIAV